jgi:aspartyl-tRNA synthetase
MSFYRTHTCNDLTKSNVGQTVKLAGWIHSKRDHGQLLFIDLRDNYGITQCVIDESSDKKIFEQLTHLHPESVVTLEGSVINRSPETVNSKLKTGEIELSIKKLEILSECDVLPFQIAGEQEYPEELRFKYRFLDLRHDDLHKTIILRSKIIKAIRDLMWEAGFTEFQTPIITVSSPEGARDFLIPSRKHPGKFYALPQAPQQFKQLTMVAGFDRYFQIAPCFRDEDSRADRALEFYQLDVEMSFVTQDDVFATMEPIVSKLFKGFAPDKQVVSAPFIRIPYREAMLKYGSDKPDLRNPLVIKDITEIFAGSDFAIFAKAIAEKSCVVRAIRAPKSADRPRSWFDKLNEWARENDMAGLGYIVFENGETKGPIAKNLSAERIAKLKELTSSTDGDSVFFVCDKVSSAAKFAGLVRNKLGQDLDLYEKDIFKLAWITEFPMYEINEETGKLDFAHNPFSMPKGGMQAFEIADPLDIQADQYDLVCNGYELCSGAIRNSQPEIMYKAFELCDYTKEDVDSKFGGMINAFKFGAPPHGGCAIGIDRVIMLISGKTNLREVTMYPTNQKGEDLMMNAPNTVSEKQLRELHIKVNTPKKD